MSYLSALIMLVGQHVELTVLLTGLLTVLLSQPVNDSPLETSRPGVVPLFGLSQVLRHVKGEIAILIFYMFMILLLPECSNTVDWVAGMVYGL